jgi:2-polyprenyl-3-methyl-5-hydroxy-6-metoxy-1,4-benzoquinol methylase
MRLVPAFANIKRVASDSRPWPGAGELAICSNCGLVQKPITDAWRRETDALYAGYRMYHQSADESEQRVVADGAFQKRSDHLLSWLKRTYSLPMTGRFLDFGCGNGVTLRAASQALPGWSLYGYDPHVSEPGRLKEIPGVVDVKRQFSSGDSFDVISLIHVLEHIPEPSKILSDLKKRLAPNGLLFIQVPYFPENRYELCVADHSSHFTLPVISEVIAAAGLNPIFVSSTVLKKEITLVACHPENKQFSAVSLAREDVEARMVELLSCVDWLVSIANSARNNGKRPFGVFGTSIAGTWLYSHIADLVDFFVDEDESRAGQSFLDRPIYLPKDVPAGSHCYLALVPEVANMVAERHKRLPVTWLKPPPID